MQQEVKTDTEESDRVCRDEHMPEHMTIQKKLNQTVLKLAFWEAAHVKGKCEEQPKEWQW